MLRSILSSILEQEESTFFHYQKHFRDFQCRKHSEWPYHSLKSILSSFATLQSAKPLYLILDAIDESDEDERRSIIELLCQLCSQENSCSVKVFLASRPVLALKHRIQEDHFVITMQNENEHDISEFAIGFLEKEVMLRGKVLGQAVDYIIGNADGVFLWVGLIKTELLTLVACGCTHAQILQCLKDLPPDLEDFYGFMFARLESGNLRDIQLGRRLFQFVLFARRPLTVAELRHALAIQDSHNLSLEEFEQNLISGLARTIVSCGGNFLEIKGKFP